MVVTRLRSLFTLRGLRALVMPVLQPDSAADQLVGSPWRRKTMAETLKDKLKRWTELVTVARTFIIALVALVAALAALVSGVAYLNKVLHQIDVNHEQAKAGVTILAQDIDKIQKTAAQNHDDIVKLNDYLLSLSEVQVDAALSGQPPPVPPPIPAPRTPQDAGTAPVATGRPPMASAARPGPVASQEPPKTRR